MIRIVKFWTFLSFSLHIPSLKLDISAKGKKNENKKK